MRPDELRYADLADDVGVGVRTVYRHFPTRETLLAATFTKFLGETVGPAGLEGQSPSELSDTLERIHARLSTDPGLYRLFFALPARSGVGMSAIIEGLCREALRRIPPDRHHAVCAAVELMLSPYAWEVFHTHWEVSPALSARTLLASVQAILDHFAARPEVLDDDASRPRMFRDGEASRSVERAAGSRSRRRRGSR